MSRRNIRGVVLVMEETLKIGFLVWNKFQVAHFAELASQFDEPDFIFIDRDNRALEGFDPTWLTPYGAYARFIKELDLGEIDGQYDAILTQFTPALQSPWKKTKLVMCQYSMAKPKTAYNARWFCVDYALVYGKYSYDIISSMCPSTMVGNPRFDPFFESRLNGDILNKIKNRIDSRKNTILFLPTWGDLNSRPFYEDALRELASFYNVIYCPHHLTPLRERGKYCSSFGDIITADEFGNILDPVLYFMAVSDLIISDMSGAIFDGVYCEKPVILLGIGGDYFDHKKAEPTALEISEQESIGPLVEDPDRLHDIIDSVFGDEIDYKEKSRSLKARCFFREGNCAQFAAEGVYKLLSEGVSQPPLQRYAGPQVRSLVYKSALMAAIKRRKRGNVKERAGNGKSKIIRNFYRKLKVTWGDIKRKVFLCIKALKLEKVYKQFVGIVFIKKLKAKMTINKAEEYKRKGNLGYAAELYGRAAKNSAYAKREQIKALQRKGDFFSTGLAVEKWAVSSPSKRRIAFYQYAVASGNIRLSRRLWRKIANELKDDCLKFSSPSGGVRKVLREMGFIDYAKKLGERDAESTESRRVSQVCEALGSIKGAAEIAARNELSEPRDKVCIDKNGKIQKLSDVDNKSIFEFVFMATFFRPDIEMNDGTRPAMIEFTKNCYEAILSLGFVIYPRLQAGLRGAATISGHHPSMTWHTTGGLVDKQVHVKVGTLNRHIIIDDCGYSGWASISTISLSELIENVDAEVAERNWQELYGRIVGNNSSKFMQTEERPPLVSDYVFLPMQVLDDTVAAHARIDCLQLLNIVAYWGEKTGRPVVVKRHPRCNFKEVEDALKKHEEAGRIIVSNASIHALITGSKCVITVNSGVGAEALIHLKPVITTGKSDYMAATKFVKNESELNDALNEIPRIWISQEKIKKFLWFYTKRYMPHAEDRTAIQERVKMLVLK